MPRLLVCYLLMALMESACSPPTPQPPPLPATVSADCAPWDGAAFTVSVPVETGRSISISIYQAPDIRSRVTFSFPDPGNRVGYAFYKPEFGPDEALSGSVTLQAAQRGIPVEGELDLESPGGLRYRYAFVATWGSQQAYCG
jgi:hypothetical protein